MTFGYVNCEIYTSYCHDLKLNFSLLFFLYIDSVQLLWEKYKTMLEKLKKNKRSGSSASQPRDRGFESNTGQDHDFSCDTLITYLFIIIKKHFCPDSVVN